MASTAHCNTVNSMCEMLITMEPSDLQAYQHTVLAHSSQHFFSADTVAAAAALSLFLFYLSLDQFIKFVSKQLSGNIPE